MTGQYSVLTDEPGDCGAAGQTPVWHKAAAVITDGTFLLAESTRPAPYTCIDVVANNTEIWMVKVCSEPGESGTNCLDPYLKLFRMANTVSASISCVFLAVTFVVYINLPELNNLHGKIVLSNVTTIFLVTFYLLFVYNASEHLTDVACKVIGYLGYFFTMSMFCWMTIMSFDLCWTFLRAQVCKPDTCVLL